MMISALVDGPVFVTLRSMRKLCFGLFVLSLPVFGAEIKFDFSNFTLNETPPGFHGAVAGTGKPGDWKIIEDQMASAFAPLTQQAGQAPGTTRHGVLAQLSQEENEERFPILVYDQE